jgi:aerobic-type carbon monoxide dehydrogenase small subunit (CoxS/CutS family)
MAFTIKVNGVDRTADVDGDTPLLWVLRDVFGMIGTKFGCGMALCGACTVHLDGTPTRSCITNIDSVGNAAVTTIEAIGSTPAGQKIQKAWLDLEATASPARSCPRPRCWRAIHSPATPTSTMRCLATFAAAGLMFGFAKR